MAVDCYIVCGSCLARAQQLKTLRISIHHRRATWHSAELNRSQGGSGNVRCSRLVFLTGVGSPAGTVRDWSEGLSFPNLSGWDGEGIDKGYR
jgi:hypothetical protein